ncbi:MAG TPA: DNA translocase FtsK 4TM domain-containing protein, partial [Stellaceae bacterium]|nr:DNA translocase FtsK 4TM domain-containing protein [Stellaceae bacterium]
MRSISRARAPELLSKGRLHLALRERVRGWAGTAAAWRRHVRAAIGFAVLIAALAVLLALLTYDPRDPSLDAAAVAAAEPHNFLGHGGALAADVLWQLFGIAGFVLPAVLFGWAFRLLLNRNLTMLGRRVALLPVALVLAALALSVVDFGTPMGGGAVGWLARRLLLMAGLGALALPLAMAAAALLGLVLLVAMGLSWRDWRDLAAGAGRGTARAATFSGRGGIALARHFR